MSVMQDLINKWNNTNNGPLWGGWKSSDNNLLDGCLRYPENMSTFWQVGKTTRGYGQGQMRQYIEYWGMPPAMVSMLDNYKNSSGGFDVPESVAISWGFASLADLNAVTGGSTRSAAADYETQDLLVSANAFDTGRETKGKTVEKTPGLVQMDIIESNIAYASMVLNPQSDAVSTFQTENSVTAMIGIAASPLVEDTKRRSTAA